MVRTPSSQKSLTLLQVIFLVVSAIALTGALDSLINREFQLWRVAILGLVLLVCFIYLTRQWLIPAFRFLHPHIVNVNPWLAIILLALAGLILYHVWPVTNSIYISFNPRTSALYNSSEHEKSHTPYLTVLGAGDKLTWVITDDGRTGNFRFKINPDVKPSTGASSGGYITFYGQPCDRLRYRTVRFRCKVTDASGNADVGVRLVVDNPKATGDRELISYEIGSLVKYGPISNSWHTFELPISDFSQVRYEPPFPQNLDENTINKMVFFVDTRIAKECQQATFWFSDIYFRL